MDLFSNPSLLSVNNGSIQPLDVLFSYPGETQPRPLSPVPGYVLCSASIHSLIEHDGREKHYKDYGSPWISRIDGLGEHSSQQMVF